MERFVELVKFYRRVKTVMSAVCVEKGGIDTDNYSGRFFVADLLEFVVAYGDKVGAKGAEFDALKAELAASADMLTPANRPIHKMSLAEFEKMIAYNGEN